MKKRFIGITVLLSMVLSCFNSMALVKAQGDILYFEEDFTDTTKYVLNRAYSKADMESKNSKLTYNGGTKMADGSSNTYTVKEHNGVRYLEIAAPSANSGTGVTGKISNAKTGTIVMEMKILPKEDGYMNRTLMAVYGQNDDGSKRYLSLGSIDGNIKQAASSPYAVVAAGSFLSPPPVLGEDGFYNLRVVMSRKTEQDSWGLYVYDMIGENIILENPEITRTGQDPIIPETLVLASTWGETNTASAATVNIASIKAYKAKEPVFTKIADYDETSKSISFSVSEPIDTTTFSKQNVVVKAPDGTDVSADADFDENGEIFTIKLDYGLPETGIYTVSVKNLKTKNKMPVNAEFEFYGEKSIIPFVLDRIDPKEGAISVGQKEIKLYFTKNIDTSTLNFVSFLTEDGDEVIGGCDISAEGRVITVSFGTLREGKYKLNIEPGLAAADEEETIVEPIEYEFTARKDFDVYEDFTSESYEAEKEYTSSEIGGLNSYLTYGATGVYTIHEEDGVKYVSMQTKAPDIGAGIAMNLDESLVAGELEVLINIKATKGYLTRSFLRPSSSDSSATPVYTLGFLQNNVIQTSTNPNVIAGTLSTALPETDADGFYHIRLNLSRPNEASEWSYNLYDELKEAKKPFYTASIKGDRLPDISKISFGDIWPTDNAQTAESLSFSLIAVSVTPNANVTEFDGDNCAPNVSELNLIFDGDLNVSDIEVSLTKLADGTKMNTEWEYFEDERKISVKVKSFLEYAEEYKLDYKSGSLTFTTKQPEFKVSSKAVKFITDAGTFEEIPTEGVFKAKCDVTVRQESRTQREILVVFTAYDKSGRIACIKNATKKGNSRTISQTIEIDNLDSQNFSRVSCLVWEKRADGYYPVGNIN